MARPRKYPIDQDNSLIPDEVSTDSARPTEMSEGEARAMEMNAELMRRLARLEAIADKTKGALYDAKHEGPITEYHGFLRYVDDKADPIISWKCLQNESYVTPRGDLVENIIYELKTMKGGLHTVKIGEWNRLRQNVVPIEIYNMAEIKKGNTEVMSIGISEDGGKSYTGPKLKIDMRFINPG